MQLKMYIMGGLAAAAMVAPAPPLGAQLLGQVGQTVDGITGTVRETVADRLDTGTLNAPVRDLTKVRLRDLLRRNPHALEADNRGFPVVRGEVVAVAPTRAAMEQARSAGFEIARRQVLEGLGLEVVTLRAPSGMAAPAALKRLRRLDPQGQYDLNHIHTSAGAGGAAAGGGTAAASGGAPRIGLIDSGVADHPALGGLVVEQRGFAPGGVTPAPHGTAVASLLSGRAKDFEGAAPGLPLLVADIYGNGPTGGSAEALARALGWMAERAIPVVNVSLVGPPNLLVRAAVTVASRRGMLIVAAVGNDGPAAGPLYPASYPGVIAVTGVDARNRVLIEAGRGSHVDFAAPGSDMAAASPGGWKKVRGTSFAAPLVAGRLALLAPQPGDAEKAVGTLAASAVDLGRRGPDPVFGRGLVCGNCRNKVR